MLSLWNWNKMLCGRVILNTIKGKLQNTTGRIYNDSNSQAWISSFWVQFFFTSVLSLIDFRWVLQFPELGVFPCKLCRARSVHFISCSFTDSVDPPLSCSASGSSFYQKKADSRKTMWLYTRCLLSLHFKNKIDFLLNLLNLVSCLANFLLH